MDTIEIIRAKNLERLLREGRSQADLSRELNKNPKQVNQWFGKGSARSISSENARHIESSLEKGIGWLDHAQYVIEERGKDSQYSRIDPAMLRSAFDVLLRNLSVRGLEFDPERDLTLIAGFYEQQLIAQEDAAAKIRSITTDAPKKLARKKEATDDSRVKRVARKSG